MKNIRFDIFRLILRDYVKNRVYPNDAGKFRNPTFIKLLLKYYIKCVKINEIHYKRMNCCNPIQSSHQMLWYFVTVRVYIHNWPLQPFSQDYVLPSLTTHVVCVNFIRKWRHLLYNVDSERRTLRVFDKIKKSFTEIILGL